MPKRGRELSFLICSFFPVWAVTLIIAHVISSLGSVINKRQTSKLCYKAVFIVPQSHRGKMNSLQRDNRMMRLGFSCHYGFTSVALVHPREQPMLVAECCRAHGESRKLVGMKHVNSDRLTLMTWQHVNKRFCWGEIKYLSEQEVGVAGKCIWDNNYSQRVKSVRSQHCEV